MALNSSSEVKCNEERKEKSKGVRGRGRKRRKKIRGRKSDQEKGKK